MTVVLTLPYPISANRYWQSFVPRGATRAIVHLSNEAKAYKKTVAWASRAAGLHAPIAGRLEVHVQLYPHRPLDFKTRMRKFGEAWDDTVQCIDLDNANKVLLDALKGIAIEDDKWVRRLSCERMEPDGEARVIVRIESIALSHEQTALPGVQTVADAVEQAQVPF